MKGKMDISIIGSDGKCIAALVFETEAAWIPMDKKDAGKTFQFLPIDIMEILISCKDGRYARIPLMRR